MKENSDRRDKEDTGGGTPGSDVATTGAGEGAVRARQTRGAAWAIGIPVAPAVVAVASVKFSSSAVYQTNRMNMNRHTLQGTRRSHLRSAKISRNSLIRRVLSHNALRALVLI